MGSNSAERSIEVRIRRVYEPPDGGYRVLVDRLWPRGLAKADAELDAWCKDVAPSAGLRKWFGHRAERFDEFARRYRAELIDNDAVAPLVAEISGRKDTVLLYGAKNEEENQAVVLRDYLRDYPRQ